MPAYDEKTLLQQLSQHNEQALTLLYKAHWQNLFLAAYNVLKDKKACEDIVQEIFLQLWMRRQSLDIRQSLSAYLATAVRYQVYHHLRQAARRVVLPEAHLANQPVSGCDEGLLKKDLHGRVHRAVEELPEKCRLIYRLSRDEQLTHKEIAVRLNISIKTVENQLTIALRRVRHCLEASSFIGLLPLFFLF